MIPIDERIYVMEEKTVRTWTEGQRRAIEVRGKTVLVSAAAGSGKTATLTERLLRRLTDKENPLELSRLLVVTFTNAAAEELRVRIRSALSDALQRQPQNRHLQRQLAGVSQAKICTIHSYCLELVRRNFQTLGLPARLRVADEAEVRLMTAAVMDELISDTLDGTVPQISSEEAAELFDCLINARSEKNLARFLLELKAKTDNLPDGTEWIRDQAKRLERESSHPFFKTPWGEKIRRYTAAFLIEYREAYGRALLQLSENEIYMKNYGTAFEKDAACIQQVLEASEAYDYGKTRKLLRDYQPSPLGSGIRGTLKTENIISCKATRDDFVKGIRAIRDRYYIYEEEQIPGAMRALALQLHHLFAFLSVYEEREKEEKKKRRILTFTDIERYAAALLTGSTGEKTDAARMETEKFDEIYIDEYQDVSPLQDAVFRAISRRNNRFMVGDIKQSIYGFRGASPDLFASYREEFAAPVHPEDCETVFLSENFRSDGHILDFSNRIFETLFGLCGGDVSYRPEDALRKGKKESGETVQTEVELILCPQTESEAAQGSKEEVKEKADEESVTEAEFVAEKISELLRNGKKRDGTPVCGGDIAILLRSTRSSAEAFENALRAKRIPSVNRAAENFFENAEVLMVLCLLQCIENPYQDIYLAGALKSPVFGVTLDEMVHIRKAEPEGSFYEALKVFVEQTGFQKGSRFLERLSYYRHRAEGMPVDKLLWFLYSDLEIFSLIYAKERWTEEENDIRSPEQMKANLMLFYEYAREFEGSSFQGLHQFVLYIMELIERKETLPIAAEAGRTDAVRIITVHQSKGLEFPVCFYCGLTKPFNRSDLRENIQMEKQAGLAMYLRDASGLARINTPVREAISLAVSEKQAEEEMRVLYVALTRPRERLYLTAAVKDAEKTIEKYRETAAHLSRQRLMSGKCSLDWILPAVLDAGKRAACRVSIAQTRVSDQKSAENQIKSDQNDGGDAIKTEESKQMNYREALRLVENRFSYRYPYADAARLPAKLSVSQLYPSVLDDLDVFQDVGGSGTENNIWNPDDTEGAEQAPPVSIFNPPSFVRPDYKREAARRGTATHVFMQFCDFSRAAVSGVRSEVSRLVREKFMTDEDAELVEIPSVERFFNSSLFEEMRRSAELYREVRFNMFFPASELTDNVCMRERLRDESVLVQGVIDCFFRNGDGSMTVVDYKTDFFTEEELKNRDMVKKTLIRRHKGQLTYYRRACETLTRHRVSRVLLYSFALGEAIDI